MRHNISPTIAYIQEGVTPSASGIPVNYGPASGIQVNYGPASGIPVNYGPASGIPVNFELESRILIDKKVQRKNTSVLQYFQTFDGDLSGGCIRYIDFICKRHDLMAVFGYTCELITQLKTKQLEILKYSIMQRYILSDCMTVRSI